MTPFYGKVTVLMYEPRLGYSRKPLVGYSRKQLEDAFQTFGRVHVVDKTPLPHEFITLVGPEEVAGVHEQSRAQYVESGLPEFVSKFQFVGGYFGPSAAIATYGWQLKPAKPAKFGLLLSSSKSTPPIPSGASYEYIRAVLKKKRKVEIETRASNHQATLKLELHEDGTIHPTVTGSLEEYARGLHF